MGTSCSVPDIQEYFVNEVYDVWEQVLGAQGFICDISIGDSTAAGSTAAGSTAADSTAADSTAAGSTAAGSTDAPHGAWGNPEDWDVNDAWDPPAGSTAWGSTAAGLAAAGLLFALGSAMIAATFLIVG